MHRRLGRKPYEVPAKVSGVPSALKEWGAHRHVGPIRCLQQEGCCYGISWEGSDSSSNESTNSSGSGSSSGDPSSLFSWKVGSLLESEQGEEAVVRTTSAEGSSGEGLRRDAQNTSQATARE